MRSHLARIRGKAPAVTCLIHYTSRTRVARCAPHEEDGSALRNSVTAADLCAGSWAIGWRRSLLSLTHRGRCGDVIAPGLGGGGRRACPPHTETSPSYQKPRQLPLAPPEHAVDSSGGRWPCLVTEPPQPLDPGPNVRCAGSKHRRQQVTQLRLCPLLVCARTINRHHGALSLLKDPVIRCAITAQDAGRLPWSVTGAARCAVQLFRCGYWLG